MREKASKYSIITFATNKTTYFEFALNCARSVLIHNDIPFYIVTNLHVVIPNELKQHVFIIRAEPEHAAMGIGIKLYTNHYLQTVETLFIDSDCLCFGKLQPIFDAAGKQSVSVIGTKVEAAKFCGDEQAKTINENFGISQLIRFNGGLYYLKKDEICHKIFEVARSIIPNYDKFGFSRIGGVHINEEGPLSISMIINKQAPIVDNGTYMTDLYTTPHPYGLNVLNGKSKLYNPESGEPKYRSWYVGGNYSPIVLHFGGSSLKSFPYIKQNLLLYLNRIGLPIAFSSAISLLAIELPCFIYYTLCTFFRKQKIR